MKRPQLQQPTETGTGTRGARGARGCPRCFGPTARVARTLPDRLLSLWMPGKRYRCCALLCNWDGLLLSRKQRKGAGNAVKPTSSVDTERVPEGTAMKQPALIAFRTRIP